MALFRFRFFLDVVLGSTTAVYLASMGISAVYIKESTEFANFVFHIGFFTSNIGVSRSLITLAISIERFVVSFLFSIFLQNVLLVGLLWQVGVSKSDACPPHALFLHYGGKSKLWRPNDILRKVQPTLFGFCAAGAARSARQPFWCRHGSLCSKEGSNPRGPRLSAHFASFLPLIHMVCGRHLTGTPLLTTIPHSSESARNHCRVFDLEPIDFKF